MFNSIIKKNPNFHDNFKRAAQFGQKAGNIAQLGGQAAILTGNPEIGLPLLAAGKTVASTSNILKKL